jgi:deazaflavin-dependent oxidoreductase (nitroreductase family)
MIPVSDPRLALGLLLALCPQAMTIEIPPAGSRGISTRLVRLFRLFNRLSVWMYRRRGGDPGGRAGLLLTTMGARSGQERTVPLGKFSDGEGRWLVVASLAGAARHPAWFINLANHPDKVWVDVGRDRFKVRPELLRGERADAWRRLVAAAPGYGPYELKTDREIPVVRLIPEK